MNWNNSAIIYFLYFFNTIRKKNLNFRLYKKVSLYNGHSVKWFIDQLSKNHNQSISTIWQTHQRIVHFIRVNIAQCEYKQPEKKWNISDIKLSKRTNRQLKRTNKRTKNEIRKEASVARYEYPSDHVARCCYHLPSRTEMPSHVPHKLPR